MVDVEVAKGQTGDAEDVDIAACDHRANGESDAPLRLISGDRAPDLPAPVRDRQERRPPERIAVIDLGTNNCRLLIAAPSGRSFRVVDSYSRIVRLGEGLSLTGRLGEAAMDRAIEALAICAEKIERRRVTKQRFIATQACRSAENGALFLDRVHRETGLAFEIISTAEEAALAARGCSDLVDPAADYAIIFDIGGGSTEISIVCPAQRAGPAGKRSGVQVAGWFSLPIGVVNMSERWGGREMSRERYETIIECVREAIMSAAPPAFAVAASGERGHLLGTSGTVTSIAGVHLGLPRYKRDAVDGLWLSAAEACAVSERLRAMSFEERALEACIGHDRADLVVCGSAILEALLRAFPSGRIRVADRGLREGVLAQLADAAPRRRRRRRRGGAKRGGS